MILLLAGTTEARKLAWLLHDYGIEAEASLAGETAAPADMGIAVRSGGFGGEDGFRRYIADKGVRTVVDATHPFASAISHRTARVCDELGLPYIRLERAPWDPEPEDKWIMVDSLADVAAHIPAGAKVLAAVGRKAAAELVLPECDLFVRVIDPQPEQVGVTWVVGRPPFSEVSEIALLQQHGIDIVIAKNSGGASDAKLLAARKLGIPVIMVNRPQAPDTLVRERVQDVFEWVLDQ